MRVGFVTRVAGALLVSSSTAWSAATIAEHVREERQDTSTTPTEVFRSITDANRQLQLLIRNRITTNDVFHQVGLATEIVNVNFAAVEIGPEYRDQLKITCCGTTRDESVIDGWTSSGVGGPSWMLNGPNPNAAKIFLNWQLSREGAIQWQLPRAFPDGSFSNCSPRSDVIEEFGCRRAHPVDGKSYVGLDYDTSRHFEREGEDLAEEIFGR